MRLPLTKHSVNPLLPSRVIKSAWKLAFVLREATEKNKKKKNGAAHASQLSKEANREGEADRAGATNLP